MVWARFVRDGAACGTLVAAVWGDKPPMRAANALQALVTRLRRVLAVAGHPGGYRLAVEPPAVDALRFEDLIAERDLGMLRAADTAYGTDDVTGSS